MKRDLNALVGQLRRQLSSLTKAIETFEGLAERRLEQHHTRSQSLLELSKKLAQSRPESIDAAAQPGERNR